MWGKQRREGKIDRKNRQEERGRRETWEETEYELTSDVVTKELYVKPP